MYVHHTLYHVPCISISRRTAPICPPIPAPMPAPSMPPPHIALLPRLPYLSSPPILPPRTGHRVHSPRRRPDRCPRRPLRPLRSRRPRSSWPWSLRLCSERAIYQEAQTRSAFTPLFACTSVLDCMRVHAPLCMHECAMRVHAPLCMHKCARADPAALALMLRVVHR